MSKKHKELDWYLHLCEKSFAGYTKLGRVSESPAACVAIQWHHNRMANFMGRVLVKFKKVKCQVLHLGRNNIHAPGRTVGSSSSEKDLGELVYSQADYKPAMCSYGKAAPWIPLKGVDSGSKDVISALCSALVRHIWSAVLSAEAQKHLKAWSTFPMRETEKEQIVQSGQEKAFSTERGHLTGVCQ